jgi:methylase of polypeptide subunit release factors
VRPDKKHLIPSVVHYDDTARVQIVDKDLSPGFYRLIEAFERLTGVPIITNTSFNIREPIVCTPQDAIKTFLRSNMAALVMGDYVIRRKEEPVMVRKAEKAAAHASNGLPVNGRMARKVSKRSLFLVQQSAENGYEITRDIPVYHANQLPKLLASQQKTEGFCLPVITDASEYKDIDQVIPLLSEQIFFMDSLDAEAMQGSRFLDIGLGSGVLSIFCLLRGAQRGVGLDINPRAKLFTGFNALLNGVEDRLEIRDGNVSSIFSPVAGEQFDLIISNPPFEPTPPGMDYYLNSSAGIYGLNFVEALLKDAGRHLRQNGLLQLVTMAPGDKQTPFMLVDLIRRYLPDQQVELILDRQPIRYDDFVERFVRIFGQAPAVIQQMKNKAKNDGVTHLHMLILKYRKGRGGNLEIRPAKKVYETWSSPLGTEVSMTVGDLI